MKRNIYKDFTQMYIDDFIETLANGCRGGLYNEVIEVYEGKEGLFKESDIKKFIRFQHGGDYHHIFSDIDDEMLTDNLKLVAKEFLVAIDTDSSSKEFFDVEIPHLIPNIKKTLTNFIKST